MNHRRTFLKQLAAIAGAPGLAGLMKLDEALAAEMERLPTGGVGSFATVRDRYLLSPDVIYFNHGSIGTIPKSVMEARAAYLDLCETNPWLYM